MIDFRIVPSMKPWPDHSCVRYGFPILDHPRGDPTTGVYIASWPDWDTAVAAAFCLNYLPNVVIAMSYFVPNDRGDWAK